MNIHPLWLICICTRLLLVYVIYYINNNKKTNEYNKYISIILFSMSIGFIYKRYFSSNNEVQIAKVFWHDSRCIHGLFYMLSSYYLINNNTNMTVILLLVDVCFSILYRIINDK